MYCILNFIVVCNVFFLSVQGKYFDLREFLASYKLEMRKKYQLIIITFFGSKVEEAHVLFVGEERILEPFHHQYRGSRGPKLQEGRGFVSNLDNPDVLRFIEPSAGDGLPDGVLGGGLVEVLHKDYVGAAGVRVLLLLDIDR